MERCIWLREVCTEIGTQKDVVQLCVINKKALCSEWFFTLMGMRSIALSMSVCLLDDFCDESDDADDHSCRWSWRND